MRPIGMKLTVAITSQAGQVSQRRETQLEFENTGADIGPLVASYTQSMLVLLETTPSVPQASANPATSPNEAAIKRARLEGLLQTNPAVLVVCDTAGCSLPPQLTTERITLRIGLNMSPPIGLTLTDDGFTAVLSFDEQPAECFVPWSEIIALSIDDASAPLEVWTPDGFVAREPAPMRTKPARPSLTLVPDAPVLAPPDGKASPVS